VRDPVSRLAKLLSMNPRDFASPVAPGQVSAPVWDENKFIAGRLAHDGEGPHGLRAGGAPPMALKGVSLQETMLQVEAGGG
jgi:hypothetical protein